MQTMQEASPLQNLQRREDVELPPMLILHGTADMNIPVGSVESFAATYRAAFLDRKLSASTSPDDAVAAYVAAGDLVQLQEFAGMPHYFLVPALANTFGPEPELVELQLHVLCFVRQRSLGANSGNREITRRRETLLSFDDAAAGLLRLVGESIEAIIAREGVFKDPKHPHAALSSQRPEASDASNGVHRQGANSSCVSVRSAQAPYHCRSKRG